MLAIARSCGLCGISGIPVRVETDIANGLPQFHIVGLTDRAIQEARQRVRAAMRNSGLQFPESRVTVNLAPAETQKEGTGFDLAIAVAVAACREPELIRAGVAFIGELSLDGRVCAVGGILPMIRSLRRAGVDAVVVSGENAAEAALVEGLRIYPVSTLAQTLAWLRREIEIEPTMAKTDAPSPQPGDADMAAIYGQQTAKRALEIAAAGRHNLLLIGPPGAGKTLLARALASILPDLDGVETLEVAEVYSAAGVPVREALAGRPPFRAPHHSISRAGLVGGGSGLARPGELSLAHRGVLFLDEICEFPRPLLEALRQPLEERSVAVTRARGTVVLPADFALVAAANPCRCGYDGDTRGCSCEPAEKERYLGKLSGPIRDRIDMTVAAPRQDYSAIFGAGAAAAESSAAVKERVARARRFRQERATPVTGHGLSGARLAQWAVLQPAASALLASAGERMQLSARAFTRVIRVARTIADLAGSEAVEKQHLAEALSYRGQ